MLGQELVSTVAALWPQFYFDAYTQPQGQALPSGKGGSFWKWIQSLSTFGVQNSPSGLVVASSIMRDFFGHFTKRQLEGSEMTSGWQGEGE